MALVAPYDWQLPSGDCVEPDLVVIPRPDFDPDGPLGAGAVPRLVVEILSPSNANQDRLLKRALYESLGVPAYWLVDPRVPSIQACACGAAITRPKARSLGTRSSSPIGLSLSKSCPPT